MGVLVRHSLIVLRPPGKEVPLDIVVEQEGERNTSPSVGQVVGSPKETAMEEDGSVEVFEEFRLVAEVVEGDGQDCTDQEEPYKWIIAGGGQSVSHSRRHMK